MITKQTKRKYERPAMQVVELRSRAMILAGSGDGGLDPLNPFNPGSVPLSNP